MKWIKEKWKAFLALLNGQVHRYPNADAPANMEKSDTCPAATLGCNSRDYVSGKSYPPRGSVARSAAEKKPLPPERKLSQTPYSGYVVDSAPLSIPFVPEPTFQPYLDPIGTEKLLEEIDKIIYQPTDSTADEMRDSYSPPTVEIPTYSAPEPVSTPTFESRSSDFGGGESGGGGASATWDSSPSDSGSCDTSSSD